MRFPLSASPARIGGVFSAVNGGGSSVAKAAGPKNKISSYAWGLECYQDAVAQWALTHSFYTPPASFTEWKSALTAAGEKIAGRKASDKKKEDAAVAVATFLAGPTAGKFFSDYVIPAAKKILGKSYSEEAYEEAMACFADLGKNGWPLWPFFAGETHPNILKAMYCERRDVFARGGADNQPLIEMWSNLIVTIKQKEVAWMASVQWPFSIPAIKEEDNERFWRATTQAQRWWLPSFSKVISGFAVVEAATRGNAGSAASIAANAINTFYTKYARFDQSISKSYIGKPSYFNETILLDGPKREADAAGWDEHLHATAAKVVQESNGGSGSGSGSSVGPGVGTFAVLGGLGYVAVKFGPHIMSSLLNGRAKR